jgi:UDP-N-acetyl-D-mannosaminuronic acid dehydrogenase
MEKREHFSNCRLLRSSREINDEMIQYWAERILRECLKINKPLVSIKICIKGITFRSGVKEFYHSRNLALARLLMEKGLDVYVFDPLLSEKDVQTKGLRYIDPQMADLIFDPFLLTFENPESREEEIKKGERTRK